MRGALTFTLLCVAVVLAAAGLHALTVGGPCYEDEPCWNCETMGNRICGLDFNGHTPVPSGQ